MQWVLAIIGAIWILWFVTRTKKTPEQIQVTKWKDLADETATKYQLNYNTKLSKAFNPMAIAVKRRQVLFDLVWVGHAHAAKDVLVEVDRIIATIEANHYALDEYGYGNWVYDKDTSTQHQKYYNFILNDNERFMALWHETEGMLDKLNELIAYVRSVAVEGVNASTEAAKVHLQVHRQDLTDQKEASAQTAKELEAHPL